jgi:RecG-like helicase
VPINIFDDISTLEQVGLKRKFLFKKNGIFQIKDLLLKFPENFLNLTTALQEGEIFIELKILRKIGFTKLFKIYALHADQEIELNFFNDAIFKFLAPNSIYKFHGTLKKNEIWTMDSPKLVNSKITILAIYKTNLGHYFLSKLILEVIQMLEDGEMIHDGLNMKRILLNLHTNVEKDRSLEALKYLEASLFAKIFEPGGDDASIVTEPVELDVNFSQQQKDVIQSVEQDLNSRLGMKHLVFGEVGAGKTFVALSIILKTLRAGYNVVLLAPTVALAYQHSVTLFPYIEKFGFKPILFTSKIKKKKKTKQAIEEGEFNFILGTHSLLHTENFKNVGLVIIDEMQKFGVLQRANLLEQAVKKNLLMLSATPIPRSLSILMKNFLQFSFLPSFYEKKIETKAMSKSKMETVVERVRNKKGYWVLPSIEEYEKSVGVKARFEILKEKELNVFLLHGKMSDADKIDVIENFKRCEVGVLVSTSVIEIGINVPDAFFIIIEDAVQFGLSSLHQLRGRVGRDGSQAYCILLYQNFGLKLRYLEENEGGFEIANKDLELRGQGQLLGIRQHGTYGFTFLTENDKDILDLAYQHRKIFKEFEYFINTHELLH